MGNLLKVLACKDEATSKINFFVDFENAQPGESELEVWENVQSMLDKATGHIAGLKDYKSASEEIRIAITNPSDEVAQEAAWVSVSQCAGKLKEFYSFSSEIASATTSLLAALTSTDKSPKDHLESQQALFKQFAQIIDFTLTFDEIKMNSPNIQNDFSFYRRQLVRKKSTSTEELVVTPSLANSMSLFYAEATPMLKAMRDATTEFVKEHSEQLVTNTSDCLCTMAEICRVMIENQEFRKRYAESQTLIFCLRVMVGVIILVDHVRPDGAFCKASGINVRSCIRLVQEWNQHPVEGLLNALRYSTRHLNDESTPKSIKHQLGV